jgi:hypothetical protein
LFESFNIKPPSASNARLITDKLSKKHIKDLYEYFYGEKIFVVVDETEIQCKTYFNVMSGKISKHRHIFVLDCIYLEESLNFISVEQHLTDTLAKHSIEIENLIMIISDAASYMIKAVKEIKKSFPWIFHVHYLANLVHNCSMRIKAAYKDIDFLIASIKGIVIKNKTNQELFKFVGKPPDVIQARWSSWLKGAMYFSEKLIDVKKIVLNLDDNGILIKNAKGAVSAESVLRSLVEVKQCYENLM